MTKQSKIFPAPSVPALMDRLTALRPAIETGAEAQDQATQLSAEVLAALEAAGLFKLLAPAELGGIEADPLSAIEVLRYLALCDGSTGWYAQAAVTGPAVAGAFLGESAVDAIFRSGGKATCAGQAAPSGKAERAGDGYRLSGKFAFASGIPNAEWVVGGYILHEGGRPVLRDNGQPVMLIAFVPRSGVEILGNWDVLGLRGTGSYDYRVPEQIVHADFIFEAGVAAPRRGGALYRMGFMAIPSLCHASFALGCGRRALDEWAQHARSKPRLTGGLMRDAETFQRDFAQAHGLLRAAEAYVRATFAALFAATQAGHIPDELKMEARLSASHAIATATRCAQSAFTAAATTSLRNGNRIQRCFRDMQAGNAHFLTGEGSFLAVGKYLGAGADAVFADF